MWSVVSDWTWIFPCCLYRVFSIAAKSHILKENKAQHIILCRILFSLVLISLSFCGYLCWHVFLTIAFLMTQLHSLSFFVLDEADRMIERGHFHELQSIIEMLPLTNGSDEQAARTMPNCETVPILQIKKRQTFVFSATLLHFHLISGRSWSVAYLLQWHQPMTWALLKHCQSRLEWNQMQK